MGIFNFRRGTIPLDDNNLANALTNRPLPVFDVLGFSQFRFVRHIGGTAKNPQIFANFGYLISGIGGLVAGTLVFQPLGPNPNPDQ